MKWNEMSLRNECTKMGQEVVAKFDSFPYMMQKIDLGRYVVLYNYGGITVDTDMVPLKPIDTTPDINTDKLIVSSHSFPVNYLSSANNALVLARPRHPVIKDLIMEIISTKGTYIANTTGPIIFSSVISKYRDSVIILDNKYYEPCSGQDPLCSPGKDAIMDHRHDASWTHPYLKIVWNILFLLLYALLFLIPIGVLYGIIILLQRYHIIPYLFKQVGRRQRA